MKNRNLKKLAVLLTLALLICSAVFVIAGAEGGENQTKPQIVSANIEYGEKFAMMFAVDVTTVSADVKLEFYNSKNELVKTYSPEPDEDGNATWTITTADNVTYNAYVFITKGVAPKDLPDYYYAKAVDGTNEGDLVRYSVAEYLYERLYGSAEISPTQKSFYESAISFGSWAQQLLINENPEYTDEVLLSDYKYIEVVGGTVDGYTAGVYPENTVLTLVPDDAATTGWAIANADGTEDSVSVNSLTLTDHCTATATIGGVAKGDRFYDFEDYADGATSVTDVILDNGDVFEIKDINGNKVLHFADTKTDVSAPGARFYWSTEAADEATVSYIYEFDFYFNSADQSGRYLGVDLRNGSTKLFKNNINVAATSSASAYNVTFKSESSVSSLSGVQIGSTMQANAGWNTVRYEYYPEATGAGSLLVYFNGIYVGEQTQCNGADKNASVAPDRFILTTTKGEKMDFYFDNVYIGKSPLTLESVMKALETESFDDWDEAAVAESYTAGKGVITVGDFNSKLNVYTVQTMQGATDQAAPENSDGTYKYFHLNIVSDNVYGQVSRVIKMSQYAYEGTDRASGQSYLQIAPINSYDADTANCFVVEFDTKISGANDGIVEQPTFINGTKRLSQFNITKSGTNLVISENDLGYDGASNIVNVEFAEDTWVTIRYEYYVINVEVDGATREEARIKLYINDTLVATSDSMRMNGTTAYNTGDGVHIPTGFRFINYRQSSSDTYIDNILCKFIDKDFAAE